MPSYKRHEQLNVVTASSVSAMEAAGVLNVVTAGSVSAIEAIELLLREHSAGRVVGTGGCLCFALADERTTPAFYEYLIKDATRVTLQLEDQIVFVVTYGDRCWFARPADYFGSRFVARYQARGLSASRSRDLVLEAGDPPSLRKDIHKEVAPPAQALLPILRRVLATLGKLFHHVALISFRPQRPTSQHLIDATALNVLERYRVRESELPCLLFVGAQNPPLTTAIHLSQDLPLQSLREDALRHIVKELEEISLFWKARDTLKQTQKDLAQAQRNIRDLPSEIAVWVNCVTAKAAKALADLAQLELKAACWKEFLAVIKEPREDIPMRSRVRHLALPDRVIASLERYDRTITELKMAAGEPELLDLLPQSRLDREKKMAARNPEVLNPFMQSTLDRLDHLEGFAGGELSRIEYAQRSLRSELEGAVLEKELRERQLASAVSLLEKTSPEAVRAQEMTVTAQERKIRESGYGGEVLTGRRSCGWAVVQCLAERGIIGSREESGLLRGQCGSR